MKVIGIGASSNSYICEIRHTEIEKFLNLYYNKMNFAKVGDEIDLSKGYDYHSEIISALRETKMFIEINKGVIRAITNGLNLATLAGVDLNDEPEATLKTTSVE